MGDHERLRVGNAVAVLIDSPVRVLEDKIDADRLAVINTMREYFDRLHVDEE